MKTLVEVEEDGDEVFIPMPKKCTRFGCRDAPPLKREGVFAICPKCRGSYGRVSLKEWSKINGLTG